jgi:N-acylneuraminate cytidylyltransferase
MSPAGSSCVAVIPARGGSTRIPRKNIREFVGRPLIAYTIEAAVQSGVFARVIVSTDDEQVAEISRTHGAEVPFMRTASLADNHTASSPVTADALERLDPSGVVYAHVAQLLPTSPLRNASDVRASYEQFLMTGTSAQISISRFGWLYPWWAFERDPQMRLVPIFPEAMHKRSQDLPALFGPVGAIWWAKAENLRQTRDFYMPGRTGWEIPWERAIDIDTEDDWKLAKLLKQREVEDPIAR